jgi:cytochrome c-type biogenesis protein CcmH/NrfG
MATLWEWDTFDEQVETEASAIREHMQLTSPGPTRVVPRIASLLEASEWAWQQGHEVRAIAALRVAVTIDRTCWQAYYSLGAEYLTIGNRWHQAHAGKVRLTDGQTYMKSLVERFAFYENAVHRLSTALCLYPQDAKGWCLLGQAQYFLGDYDRAQASFRKALDLDPLGENGRVAKESLVIFDNSPS